MILAAMKFLQNNTCVKFMPTDRTDNKTHRIVVTGAREDSCSAWVAYRTDLEDKETKSLKKKFGFVSLQTVSLGKSCLDSGTIQHELLHALGLYHEQSRYDRDEYVQILWDNIEEGNNGRSSTLTKFIRKL